MIQRVTLGERAQAMYSEPWPLWLQILIVAGGAALLFGVPAFVRRFGRKKAPK